jgi:integrase
MAARMVRTSAPGIYRRGDRYVVTYRGHGRQRKESAATMAEARALKATREAEVARGEFYEASHVTFRQYAGEWIERYYGRRRGFSETTRDRYKIALRSYVFPHFAEKRLAEITPRDLSTFVGWLCDEHKQGVHWRALKLMKEDEGKPYTRALVEAGQDTSVKPRRHSDSSVSNIVKPIRSCLATAVNEGLIRHNPTIGLALPHRPTVEDLEAEPVLALTREQLATLLELVDVRHRSMFRLMAATGLRISETLALQWRHLELNGSAPHVRVRRQIYRGRLGPPKTKYGRRDVPLEQELVFELRRRRADSEWPGEEHLVFPSLNGTPLSDENLRRRVFRPAAEEAGVAWATPHALRHTCASMLFDRGANAKQVQRWLGHHSASFTLDTYIHLLSEDLDEPLSLTDELRVATGVATQGSETEQTTAPSPQVDLAA